MGAVMYCRVSTEQEDQDSSFIHQQERWSEIVKQNKLTVYPGGIVETEDGLTTNTDGIFGEKTSGLSISKRKVFQRMIQLALDGHINHIYVQNLSRFSRNTVNCLQTISDLRAKGCYVTFLSENLCTKDINSDFIISILISIAQAESTNTSSRVKFGKKRAAMNGYYLGGVPPYGYKLENKMLEVIPEQAEVVRMIFELYLNKGYGTQKIARYLNAANIRPQRADLWSGVVIGRILRNTTYTGLLVQHKEESYDIIRHSKIAVPKDEWIIHRYEQYRIISDEVFAQVQQQMKQRKELRTYSRHSSAYALSNLLRCQCGACYKRKKRHAYKRKDGSSKDLGYEWSCAAKDMLGEQKCSFTRAAVTEEEMLKAIGTELLAHRMDNLDYIYAEIKNKKIQNSKIDITAVKAKKQNVQNLMAQLRQELLDGLLDTQTYSEQMSLYNDQNALLNEQIQVYENIEQTVKQLANEYANYKKAIQKMDINDLSNTTLRNIFDSITVQARMVDGKKHIYARYNYRLLGHTVKQVESELGIDWDMWILIK